MRFAAALSHLRTAFLDVPLTPLPSKLAKIIFSETLEELSISWKIEELCAYIASYSLLLSLINAIL